MKVQASMLKESDVPIYGVGIQSHIKNANLDITAMKVSLLRHDLSKINETVLRFGHNLI